MDVYSDNLVDFYVWEGKCKTFIECVTLFHNCPGCWGANLKYLGDQVHKKGNTFVF